MPEDKKLWPFCFDGVTWKMRIFWTFFHKKRSFHRSEEVNFRFSSRRSVSLLAAQETGEEKGGAQSLSLLYFPQGPKQILFPGSSLTRSNTSLAAAETHVNRSSFQVNMRQKMNHVTYRRTYTQEAALNQFITVSGHLLILLKNSFNFGGGGGWVYLGWGVGGRREIKRITKVLITANEGLSFSRRKRTIQPNEQKNRTPDRRSLEAHASNKWALPKNPFPRQNVERELNVYFKNCLTSCYVIAAFVRGQGRGLKFSTLYYSHANRIRERADSKG